jgi:hypothetical protein
MGRQELEERYGKVKVVSNHYYKYTFTFIGESDGDKITACVGGDADEIYKEEVDNEPVTISALMPYSVYVNGVEIFNDY